MLRLWYIHTIWNDLTTFKNAFEPDDYFLNFPLFLEIYNKKIEDLHLDTLRNITEYVASHYNNDNELVNFLTELLQTTKQKMMILNTHMKFLKYYLLS